MANLNELREERGKLVTEMKKMTSAIATEKREFSGEENEKFDAMDKDQAKLRSLIDRIEQTDNLDNELKEVKSTGIGREDKVITKLVKPEEVETNAWRSFLQFGPGDMNHAELSSLRALGATGTGAAGGYIAPSQPTSDFFAVLRDLSGVLSAPVYDLPTNSGNTIPYPTTDDTSNAAEALAENTNAAEADPTFGQKNIAAYAYSSKVVRISKQLLQDSVIPIESLINKMLAERLSTTINTALTTGSGSSAPQGIVTGAGAASFQFPATTLGASGSAVYQNFQKAYHAVAPQYRKTKSYGIMFNDNTLLELKKQVDGQSRPLWVAGMASGEPDRVCNLPYYVNPDMADIGTGNKSVVVGDFSQFIVRRVNQVEFIRMDELYAQYLQVGFLCWVRIDSRVMNSSAIKYIQHATA